MGWFDKKSWQKRRKIKDLQADLIKAERDGKYVVEQGLFFAELQDMGDATMMLFGAAKELSGSEESIIRTFFDRNGFQVERLKMERDHSGLSDVEIIPPEEMTRWVGRIMKAQGYRLLDDSDDERPAELGRHMLPLSSLVRGIICLFAERVQRIISTTSIKMNKEGNRLLHWMPKIAECQRQKLDPAVLDLMRDAFDDSYGQFFLRLGSAPDYARPAAKPAGPVTDETRIPSFPSALRPEMQAAAQPPLNMPAAFRPFRGASPSPEAAVAPAPAPAPLATNVAAGLPSPVNDRELLNLTRALDVSEAVGRMYKSLVGANSSRCVKNAEVLLEEVNKLFQASATCVMVKIPSGTGLTIHAQAGQKLAWGDGGGAGYPVSSSVLGNCIRHRTAVTNEESGGDPTASMIAHKIEATAAAPIVVKDEIVGILYLDRRGGIRPFTDDDCEILVKLAKVFREFPDLTLGLM